MKEDVSEMIGNSIAKPANPVPVIRMAIIVHEADEGLKEKFKNKLGDKVVIIELED